MNRSQAAAALSENLAKIHDLIAASERLANDHELTFTINVGDAEVEYEPWQSSNDWASSNC